MRGRRDEGKLGDGGLGWHPQDELVEDSGSHLDHLDEEEEVDPEEEEVDPWVRDG